MKYLRLFDKFIFDHSNQIATVLNTGAMITFNDIDSSATPKDIFDNIVKDRMVDLDHKGYTIIISKKSSPALLHEDSNKLVIRIFNTNIKNGRESINNFNSNDVIDDIISVVSELKENGMILKQFSFREFGDKSGNKEYRPFDVDKILPTKLKDKVVRNIKLLFERI